MWFACKIVTSAALLLAVKSYISVTVQRCLPRYHGLIFNRVVMIGIFLNVLPIDTQKGKAISMLMIVMLAAQ